MALFAVVQLFSRTSLVDTHHGDTDGPGCLADAEPEIAVVGVDVAALLEGLDDFDDGLEEGVVEVAGFELAEELQSDWLANCSLIRVLHCCAYWLHVLAGLDHGAVGHLAVARFSLLFIHCLFVCREHHGKVAG